MQQNSLPSAEKSMKSALISGSEASWDSERNHLFCHDSVFCFDIPGKAVYIITRFFTGV